MRVSFVISVTDSDRIHLELAETVGHATEVTLDLDPDLAELFKGTRHRELELGIGRPGRETRSRSAGGPLERASRHVTYLATKTQALGG